MDSDRKQGSRTGTCNLLDLARQDPKLSIFSRKKNNKIFESEIKLFNFSFEIQHFWNADTTIPILSGKFPACWLDSFPIFNASAQWFSFFSTRRLVQALFCGPQKSKKHAVCVHACKLHLRDSIKICFDLEPARIGWFWLSYSLLFERQAWAELLHADRGRRFGLGGSAKR